jgi:HlyD family secretion protein
MTGFHARHAICLALCGTALLSGCSEQPIAQAAHEPLPPVEARGPLTDRISALGRLEPEDGLIRVAGPSGDDSVIGQLFVDEGEWLKKGMPIATLDSAREREARVERLASELAYAKRELARKRDLHSRDAISDSLRDEWETQVRVTRSQLQEAEAMLARAHVLSPIDGRVIAVHARESERVGPEGIVELGRTAHMFAIAEVYETDVGRVRQGQRAVVTSPALPGPLSGSVDWVHLKVAKQDTLGTDPAARKDARVVEVEIRLDDSEAAAAFTNLQVEVVFEP